MQLMHLKPINSSHGHQKLIKRGHFHHFERDTQRTKKIQSTRKNSTKLLQRPLLCWRSFAATTTIRWSKSLGGPPRQGLLLLSHGLDAMFQPVYLGFFGYITSFWSLSSKTLRFKPSQENRRHPLLSSEGWQWSPNMTCNCQSERVFATSWEVRSPFLTFHCILYFLKRHKKKKSWLLSFLLISIVNHLSR